MSQIPARPWVLALSLGLIVASAACQSSRRGETRKKTAAHGPVKGKAKKELAALPNARVADDEIEDLDFSVVEGAVDEDFVTSGQETSFSGAFQR